MEGQLTQDIKGQAHNQKFKRIRVHKFEKAQGREEHGGLGGKKEKGK